MQSNNLTNYGQDMAGVIQLSEALKANKTLETLKYAACRLSVPSGPADASL